MYSRAMIETFTLGTLLSLLLRHAFAEPQDPSIWELGALDPQAIIHAGQVYRGTVVLSG
jgi:hypothetical protein